jgi:hypothetical protein
MYVTVTYCDCVSCTVVVSACFVMCGCVYVWVFLENCVSVVIICALVLFVMCFVLFVMCFCIVSFVYIYSYLFCLYWCQEYCHRVTTQLLLMIMMMMMIIIIICQFRQVTKVGQLTLNGTTLTVWPTGSFVTLRNTTLTDKVYFHTRLTI